MKINLPDYCVPATFHLTRPGNVDHDHVWEKREHDDFDGSWVEWNCDCGARAVAEIYQ